MLWQLAHPTLHLSAAAWHDACAARREAQQATTLLLTACPPAAVNGRVRMGIAQLDASQTTFNASAAWVVDSFTDKVGVLQGFAGLGRSRCIWPRGGSHIGTAGLGEQSLHLAG